jgi:hypothetical protein
MKGPVKPAGAQGTAALPLRKAPLMDDSAAALVKALAY